MKFKISSLERLSCCSAKAESLGHNAINGTTRPATLVAMITSVQIITLTAVDLHDVGLSAKVEVITTT